MQISALTVSRPVTTGRFFLAVLVLGLVSLSRLAVDQLPDVTRPSVTVLTIIRGRRAGDCRTHGDRPAGKGPGHH